MIACRSCNSRKSRSKPGVDGGQAPAIGPEAVSLGTSLRAAREAMGYDLAELARRTRFSVVFLEAAEAGEIALRPDHLERIRWWLGMVPPYLRVPPPDQDSRAGDAPRGPMLSTSDIARRGGSDDEADGAGHGRD